MTPNFLNFTVRFLMAGTLAAAFSSCSRDAKKAGHLRKADEYFAAAEFEKAEIEYKNVLQLVGLDPHSVGRLGIIYFEQGRLARATGFLLKAHELQPDNLDVRSKLGHLYLATGKPSEARAAAIFILERNPQHADAPMLLAESVMQAKDATDARSRLQKLPNAAGAPALAALGVLDMRERKYKEAEVLLERARQADPKYVVVYSALGRMYLGQKDLVRAEKAFATAAELAPPRSPVRLQYVQFNLQNGKIEEGKQILEEVIRTTPDFLPSYVLLANIVGTEKKYDESIALLEKVLSSGTGASRGAAADVSGQIGERREGKGLGHA